MQRRVVITGLGVVAPNGIGKEAFWDACISGRSGVRLVTRIDTSMLPTRIAGEVPDFEPEAFGISREELLFTDRNTRFALVAAHLALQDADLLGRSPRIMVGAPLAGALGDGGGALAGALGGGGASLAGTLERDRTGVYMGSAMASIEDGENLWLQLMDRGAHPPEYTMNAIIPPTLFKTHAPAAAIAARYHLHGPCTVISTACSAGGDAIGEAYWAIQEGQADCMLAGGTDSAITLGGLAAFSVMKALSTRNEEPERASRPYDKDRDGFVLAEGAGVLVLEERERALARNAHIYAEVIAFASNSNSHHMTALPPDGAPLQELIRQVLNEAGITPAQLGYINSHGGSTPPNEAAETVAYKAAFGEHAYRIPISSTKSMIGHTQGAASAIEAIVTALVLDRQVIPPTINQEHPDPQCDLDYVPNVARQATVNVALTHSSGFGGVNSALILARPGWNPRSIVGAGLAPALGRAPLAPMVQQTRRVVITGLGVVAANGTGKEAFWQATSKGISGIKPISRIPTTDLSISVAGEVSDFVANDYIDRKLANRTDRVTHFAFAAVQEALQDAKLVLAEQDTRRVGVVIANTVGGIEYLMEQSQILYKRGPRSMSAYTAIAWLQVANIGQISLLHGIQGYCKAPVNDTVGGLDALGMAYRAIRRGVADIIITGGCEALLHPFVLYAMARSDYVVLGDDPNAYRPFDRRAAGFLLAEGAGICILEDYEHAKQRRAPIYGEIVGYGQSNDAHGLVDPSSNGSQYAHAIRLALEEGDVHPEHIAYFSLDGRAVPTSDQGEVDALHRVFGSERDNLPVSIPRTMLGHSYAAAGTIDAITALLALQHDLIPPTINCEELDPHYGLNLVQKEARPLFGSTVLIGGRGLGGANVVLVIKKVEE